MNKFAYKIKIKQKQTVNNKRQSYGVVEECFWHTFDIRNAEFQWPPYSPDLNPCIIFLWGFLKSRVYSDPVPETAEQLKNNIKREVRRLKQETASSVIDNVLVRVQNLLMQKGAWFEQIINYECFLIGRIKFPIFILHFYHCNI